MNVPCAGAVKGSVTVCTVPSLVTVGVMLANAGALSGFPPRWVESFAVMLSPS